MKEGDARGRYGIVSGNEIPEEWFGAAMIARLFILQTLCFVISSLVHSGSRIEGFVDYRGLAFGPALFLMFFPVRIFHICVCLATPLLMLMVASPIFENEFLARHLGVYGVPWLAVIVSMLYEVRVIKNASASHDSDQNDSELAEVEK